MFGAKDSTCYHLKTFSDIHKDKQTCTTRLRARTEWNVDERGNVVPFQSLLYQKHFVS